MAHGEIYPQSKKKLYQLLFLINIKRKYIKTPGYKKYIKAPE